MASSSSAVVAAAAAAAASSSSPRFRTWPITAAKSIETQLKEMGLKIPASRIDGTTQRNNNNNDKTNGPIILSDALVSVGTAGHGGTGSFVSNDGLILTNWHVAYDAVRQASLASQNTNNNKQQQQSDVDTSTTFVGKDYVQDGFVASNKSEELPGPNYEVWITKSCVDVSDQVLTVIASETTDPLKRANRVRDIMQEIAQKAQQEQQQALAATTTSDGDNTTGNNNNSNSNGIRCDVQEMLPNESYVLFTYQRLRDVRIVYVPPKSLGNFGGDTDNFEWPRHTADFTLLRAYVGPNNGEAAEYSPDNIPYDSSNARLVVQKNGASEGDMVFLLGFPGRTMRYAPTCRLQYANDIDVPNMVKDFTRKLQLIAEYEIDSPLAALKLGNSKKGLANELKRSTGKLIMMRKLGLISERRAEEEMLCQKSNDTTTTTGKKSAKQILDRLSEIYNDHFRKTEPIDTALEACRGIYAGSALLAAGHSLHEYLAIEMTKPDEEREASYRQRNLPFLFRRLAKRIGDIHLPHETALIQDALEALASVPELEPLYSQIFQIFVGEDGSSTVADGGDNKKKVDYEIIKSIAAASKLMNLNMETLEKLQQEKSDADDSSNTTTTTTTLLDDPFVKCAAVLYGTYQQNRDTSKALLSERDALFAELLDFQRKFSNEEVFYPDCNGSLRISAGHVEGYQAADAVIHKPSTTLAGLFDKATEAKLTGSTTSSANEFDCPDRLYQMLLSSSSSSSSKNGDDDDDNIHNVPVCLLYSTDTVGGNSGSPVMNAYGELVGINFDRQRQGLMNEYKWSKDYSRSIGVDVRYMLWLIGKYDGATHLVDEMLS